MKSRKFLILSSVLSILFLIGVAIFLYNYDFPKKIDVNRTAVVFKLSEPGSTKKTSIKIEGTLYKPLFKQQKFIGSFKIDDFDFTKNQDFTFYIFDRKKDINMSALYYVEASPPHNIKNNSLIWFDDHFENINIWPSKDWIDQDSTYITTGDSYEQAIEVQNMMRDKFGESFVPHAVK